MINDKEEIAMLLYRLDTAKTDLEIFAFLLQRYGADETRVLLTALARVEKLVMAANKTPTRYQA
jgi:hypothetical protein